MKKTVDEDDDEIQFEEQATRRGRAKGSSQYSHEERAEIVQLMNKLLPTGGKAWDALSATYNKWAKNRNFPERKRALRQNHCNKILNQAKDRPTGTGEQKQLVATNSIEDESRSFNGDSAPLSPLLPQPVANRPTIASSSAVNLNNLASIAAGLPNAVAPGNTLSIRADNEGYFNVQNDIFHLPKPSM
ncbi:hypothetical protein F5876DRAFT_70475 [Lentinula aff. lateritia]|uniref:Uncharacterized protein n=1 Tax=Lentinula aff. lateritia TaxID=2804960 RepID=A0ACC1TIM5_9AGAR|nr:hypothetical protein F5876DRAFT_70475 [Lentinula aff. lateritia]